MCHTLFSGGHYLQEMHVPVEVSIPAGNFDNLGNVFLGGRWSQPIKILIFTLQSPSFYTSGRIFQEDATYKKY